MLAISDGSISLGLPNHSRAAPVGGGWTPMTKAPVSECEKPENPELNFN